MKGGLRRTQRSPAPGGEGSERVGSEYAGSRLGSSHVERGVICRAVGSVVEW